MNSRAVSSSGWEPPGHSRANLSYSSPTSPPGLVTYNVHQALARVEERVEVIAYMRDDAEAAEITVAQEVLLEMEEVRAVRHISKEEALRQAREELPEFQEIFRGLEVNPLPASLEVELHPGFRTPESVARVAGIASLYAAFEEVAYGQEWVNRVYLLRSVGAVATSILGTAFAVVAALIIATAVRIAIFARGDEIRIMRLVGATNGFIRRPFLLEGFVTGALGGGPRHRLDVFGLPCRLPAPLPP